MSLETINNTYGLKLTFVEYHGIRLSIPLKWRKILNGNEIEVKNESTDLYGKLQNLKNLKTRQLYWVLIGKKYDISSKPPAQIHWEEKYEIDPQMFEVLYSLPYKVIRLTNVQSMQYKILYRIINCKYLQFIAKITPGRTTHFTKQGDDNVIDVEIIDEHSRSDRSS